jgi:hypothetical protein
MSLALTQVAVSSTAVELAVVSRGAHVILSASAATTVGTSASVTTTTGFVLAAGVPVGITIPPFVGQQPVTLYGIAGSPSVVSVAIADQP